MRPAIVLGLLATVLVLRIALGGLPGASFDDRFDSAEAKLDALSRDIEEELDKTRSR